jgi:hypothetical protein
MRFSFCQGKPRHQIKQLKRHVRTTQPLAETGIVTLTMTYVVPACPGQVSVTCGAERVGAGEN